MSTAGTPAPETFVDRMMKLIWRKPADSVAESGRRRITLYLIPYLFFLYILAYLDRVNVSMAQLELEMPVAQGGMGFDKAIFGFGAGIFFFGYWILEIPSTLSVLKWGARYVFVRILVLWGIACMLIGTIHTELAPKLFVWSPNLDPTAGVFTGLDAGVSFLFGWVNALLGGEGQLVWFSKLAEFFRDLPTNAVYQFYFWRFMLGFFEGGFFPSVILYLSLWFRAGHRAKAIATFMSAIPISIILGAPVSSLMLQIHWLDLEGWRWLFFLQGAVPVLAGFATLFFLPNRPEDARWLPADERADLVQALQQEAGGKTSHHNFAAIFGSLGMVSLLTMVYFCQNVTSYGLSMFMPSIIKSQTGLTSNVLVGLLTAVVYLLGLVGMLLNGWHSDKTNERIGHVSVPLYCMSAGLLIVALMDGTGWSAVLAMVLLVGTFTYSHLPAFWPIPTMFLGASAAASAIGFINMVGNLGGFTGPTLVGEATKDATSFREGLLRLVPFPAVAATIILLVSFYRARTQKHHGEAVEHERPPTSGKQ